MATAETLPQARQAVVSRPAGELRRLLKSPVAVASGLVIGVLLLTAICAPTLAPYAYDQRDRAYLSLPAPADARHRLGTDHLGQDVMSRLIYGAQVSLGMGVMVTLIQAVIGVGLGLLAASGGRFWDPLLMRLTDAMFAFPDLLFAILVVGILRPGSPAASLLTVFAALALVGWPGMARLVRGQALALCEKEYVEAARALGMRDAGILIRHLLPNMLSPIVVAMTVDIAGVILGEATLSFLGIGVQPPYPSWGRMIYDAVPYWRSDPTLILYPSLMLAVTVLTFNFFGDALRDALDPRLRA